MRFLVPTLIVSSAHFWAVYRLFSYVAELDARFDAGERVTMTPWLEFLDVSFSILRLPLGPLILRHGIHFSEWIVITSWCLNSLLWGIAVVGGTYLVRHLFTKNRCDS